MQHSAHRQTQKAQVGRDISQLSAVAQLPSWLPNAFRLYLEHTEAGQSIRALARQDGLNASTVLRQVRRCEMRRDDPLIDEALCRFQRGTHRDFPLIPEDIMHHSPISRSGLDDAEFAQAAPRLLRRLAETGAFLAIAPAMEKAAVMRALPDGRLMRMAVVDRALAQIFALKEWIAPRAGGTGGGKVDTYELTAAGRAELKARIAAVPRGMNEASARFSGADDDAGDDKTAGKAESNRRIRYNLAESPVAVLGRRREKDGSPYLPPDFVRAAERLREDFELAQMGTSVAQNWEGFLTGGVSGGASGGRGAGHGQTAPRDARARVSAALTDLGPDLGHIALRVCCYLEGVEEAERRMGWAARSGKVVLRIALRRLARHYDEVYGRSGPLIG
jgi:hypothetical protein